jgi:Molybdopterin-guanine dinucleotide biosynthesis protein A
VGRLPVTGVVLAGGASRRMGRDKAFLDLGGRPLIAHVLERMGEVCAETLIVANDIPRYAGLGVRVVPDVFPGVGVLGGSHAKAIAASTRKVPVGPSESWATVLVDRAICATG